MSLYSLEKKEDSQIKSEHKENVGNLHIIKLPLTKYELSLFKCEDPIIIEKQLGIYETFSSLPQKLRILPKFHGKSPEGLFFQPLRKTLKLHLKENPIVSWKDLLKHYKALINGLACLQSFGILALKLDLDSIYVSESGEYKVLIYDTINGDKHDILDNSVFELALLIISLGIGKNADINILDEHFLEFQSKIHVNGFEEKQQLKELILTLKSILSKNSEKLDFLQLFIRSLNFKSFDNIKKMIIIEETHGLEIAYDILIKKEFMKFQLKSLDNKLRIFGFSSIPLDKEFEKIEEIKLCLDEIKPIRSLNFLISSDFNEESFELIDNILSKKVFRLDDFKSLIIQMAPSKQVVGFSEWFKFIWHSFYKDGLKPIDSSGLAIIKEHYSYWGNGIGPNETQKIFELLDKNWIKERKIEELRIVLSSYYLLTEDCLKTYVLPNILSLKLKKIKKLEIGFEISSLKDQNVFTMFLKNLGLKLRQENKEGLACLSIFLYTYFPQGACLDEIKEILSFQNQIYSFSLFLREVTNKMSWDQFVAVLTPEKICNFSSLTLCFGSWVYCPTLPYLSDQCFAPLLSKLVKHLSQKLQNFSILIYSQGIMEESFQILSDLLSSKGSELLSCNFYFESFVENEKQKKKAEKIVDGIKTQLRDNLVEVNAFRIELYKKK